MNTYHPFRSEIIPRGHGGFRCAKCGRMQPSGSLCVFMPEGSSWTWCDDTFEEMAAAFPHGSGHSSGWCEACVLKSKGSVAPRLEAILNAKGPRPEPPNPYWIPLIVSVTVNVILLFTLIVR